MSFPSWIKHAACRGVDPELFFPRVGRRVAQVEESKRICESCPVIDRCRDDANDRQERYGTRGGLTATERINKKFGAAS